MFQIDTGYIFTLKQKQGQNTATYQQGRRDKQCQFSHIRANFFSCKNTKKIKTQTPVN